VCAAEIYDAITTSRPYQDTLEPEEAIVQMRRLAGTKLDPAVVSALSRAVARHKTLVFVDSSDSTVGSLGAEEVGGGGEAPEK